MLDDVNMMTSRKRLLYHGFCFSSISNVTIIATGRKIKPLDLITKNDYEYKTHLTIKILDLEWMASIRSLVNK